MKENNTWWQDEEPVDKDSLWKKDGFSKSNYKTNENVEDLLKFFKEEEVSIQITLDYSKMPTVHALYMRELYKTSGQTVLYCLQRMKEKIFN